MIFEYFDNIKIPTGTEILLGLFKTVKNNRLDRYGYQYCNQNIGIIKQVGLISQMQSIHGMNYFKYFHIFLCVLLLKNGPSCGILTNIAASFCMPTICSGVKSQG